MPRLAVSDNTTTPVKIVGVPGRKMIAFRNAASADGGSRVFWTRKLPISGNIGEDACGIFLEPGEAWTLAGDDCNIGMPVYFVCAAGSTTKIYYPED